MSGSADDSDAPSAIERLQFAAKSNNEQVYNEVIAEAGASLDFNAQDGIGNTALHYAAQCGSLDIAQLLVDHAGIKLDVQNRQWQTPLFVAASHGEAEIVQLLIEAGANPSLADKQRSSPASVAKSKEIKDMINSAVVARSLAADDLDQGDSEEEDEEGEEEDE
ncbi:hypothetical protein CAOG_05930 [Capsaspora owczarzaki ATCC 30864]|uniref:Uncharacterized protein n=1 Tax=Capsaspora owczarzaki (strain ATCC 30864) TaxID=595528 RepID=A0A0D2UK43_CAPO3|nr:hypothetical protein CAOG_05930 [Capsaspora owczarzaki ATCC 30864]KJE95481.1 hypothetical protein CAOG_005930 [Capsaspora owczarzaki ATCC 30864]|eukprot:XP_004345520.1 hypothetical protein CAOG_05930 [Capsaspora owczarzaki ATCC 30864]